MTINLFVYGQNHVEGVETSDKKPNGSTTILKNGNNTLGTSINYKGCGINIAYSNYLKTYTGHSNEGTPMIQPCTGTSGSESCGMIDGASLPGTLTITGIPANAIIVQAFLHIPVQESSAGALPSFTLQNTNGITSTVSPTLAGTTQNFISFSFINESVYRADVTSLFSGNGNYIISGLPQDYTTGNPPVATGPTRPYGIQLYVIYRDPNASYIGNVVIADGTLVFGTGGSPSSLLGVALTHNLTGLNPCSNSTNGIAFMAINNLQNINTCKLGINSPFGIWNDSIIYGNQTYTDFIQTTTSINSGQTGVNFSASRPTYQASNGQWNAEYLSITLAGVYFQTSCPNILQSNITTNVGCSTASATVSVTGGTPPYQITWNTNPVQTGATATGLSNGTYIVTIKDTTNCSEIQDTVVIIGIAGTPTAVNSDTICAGGSVTLNASGADSYTWSPVSGLSSTTGTSVVASPGVTTTYTIVGETNGCTDTTTATVTVISPSVSAPLSLSICSGDSVLITASGATQYTWEPATGLSSTMGSTVMASPSTTTSYTIVGDLYGCLDSTTIIVNVNSSQSATFNYDGPYCQNDIDPSPTIAPGSGTGTFSASPSGLVFVNVTTGVVDLSASAPGTYTVTNLIGASGSCPASSSTAIITINANQDAGFTYPSNAYCEGTGNILPTVTGTNGGTFTVSPSGLIINALTGEIDLSSPANSYTITYTTPGPCAVSSTQIVQIASSLFVIVSSDVICEGEVATLTATPSVPGGTYSWNPEGQTSTSVDVAPDQTTNYTVIYTLNGCTASGSGIVTVNTAPDAHISTPYTTISEGETIFLNAGSADSYEWSTGQSTQTISVSPEENATYCVVVTDNGCADSTCIDIVIGCESVVYAPNCITANGDMINDEFIVQGDCLSEFHLMIFNRWGELIFESFDIAEAWNGTYKGKPVSDGVYTYLIVARGIDNQFYELQGFVTVIR